MEKHFRVRIRSVRVQWGYNHSTGSVHYGMVLDVPFEMLVGYVEEPELNEMPIVPIMEDIDEITEDDIPAGNTKEDRRKRQDLIYAFYMGWKRKNL